MFKITFKTLIKRYFSIASLVLLSLAFNNSYAQGLKIMTQNKPTPRSCDCSPFYKNSSFKNPKLISGSALSLGSVYRFSNVFPNNQYGTTIDALVKVVEFNNGASLLEMDVTSTGIPEAFQPRINSTNKSDQSVLFNITFVSGGGTYGDEVVISYYASPYDIDGDGVTTREYAEISLPDAYFVSNNTLIDITQTATLIHGEAINSSTAPKGDISIDSRYTYSSYFENKSSFTYKIGKKDGNSDRYYSLDMTSANYTNPNSVLITYPVICGTVKDIKGSPLSNVKVDITGSDGSVQNLTTNSSGDYKAVARIPEALVDVEYKIRETDLDGYISVSDVDGANDNLITKTINLASTCGNDFVDGFNLKITVDSKTDILCNGSSTGEIKVSATGGVPPYKYIINGSAPQSSALFEGLSAGKYTIKLIDSLGNTETTYVTISEPEALSVIITKENATSSQDCNNGKATATVVGGESPYTYLWSASAGNQTTITATNIPSGTHTVTIKDANNCVLVQGVVMDCSNTCDAIVKVNNVTDVLCAGEASGSATVSASSNANTSAKFTFTWNTTPVLVDSGVTTSTLSGLKAGIYSVSVTIDGTVCQPVEQFVTIVEPANVLNASAVATDESGPNTGDGTATVTANGGTPPYTYLWSPGGQTTENITGLSAGNYTVTVTDAQGCAAIATVKVNPESCKNLSVDVTTTEATCNGESNGTASANVSGGSGSFTYLWSPGGETTQSITGLSAGTFTVSITDIITKCTFQTTVKVKEPNALSSGIAISNILCFGEKTGSLDLTVTGGTFPYEFLWSNGVTTEDLNNLSDGTYLVSITDAKGCTTSNTAIVKQPDSGLEISILSQSNIVCYSPLGSVKINATGGITPYSYDINGTIQSTDEFTGLEAGDYTISVLDANGCEKSVAFTILNNCTDAVNDINNTFVDTPVTGNVLTNDTDPEGDTQLVTTTTVTTAQGVVVTIDATTGIYTYTPPAGYVGEDSFEYTICDDGTPEACDTATVYIEVLPIGGPGNEAPIANADTGGTETDTPVTGNVLSNDFDPDGDPIVVTTTTVTTTEGVVVTIDPTTGVYTYAPPTGFIGEDSFEYTICDNGTPPLCDTATVVITVSPNNGNTTIANDDAIYNNTCDSITGNVLLNDSDPEGDTQTVNATPVKDVANGTLVLSADGTFTYAPNAGFTGADSFVYSVCDNGTPQACDQATVYITITDAEAPFIVNCNVEDKTMECSGLDNKTLAETWNSENIAALEICAEDICDVNLTGQVTSDFDFNNFQSSCGLSGSIEVTYTITDDSGNVTTLLVKLTLEDTTPPDISDCVLEDKALSCTLTTAKENANQWDLDNIAILEACANDACSVNQAVIITSNYNFDNLDLGQQIVVYTVTDDCGNSSTTDAMLTLQNDAVSSSDISLCVASEVESQVFNLFNLLSGNYNTGGTWEVVLGDGAVIDGHFFNPKSVILDGENASEIITFSYTEVASDCPTYIEASIDVNNACQVKGCDLDNIVISILLTPNGDIHNEYFTVKGVEDCDFKIDVKIVNRWGAIIFQSNNYQNDWNAFIHKSSLGSAAQVPSGTYYYVVTLINSGKAPITGLMYIGTK